MLVCLCASCGQNPSALPEASVRIDAAQIAIGHAAHAELLRKFPPYDDEALQRYVRGVGVRLVAAAPPSNASFGFTVLDTPGAFAYSYAGGDIVVSRGLLIHLNSEAQLAAVLAHEIGHVLSLHVERTRQALRRAAELEAKMAGRLTTQQGREALGTLGLARVRGYSRQHEIEADAWSERLLKATGYDSRAGAEVLRFSVQQEAHWDRVGFELWEIPESAGGRGVFATHPSSAARLELALKRLGIASLPPAQPDLGYFQALQGVVFGLSKHHGVQRGQHYVHAGRRIAFTIPEGWYLFGEEDRLVAASRGDEGLLVLRMEERAGGKPPRRALEELSRGRVLKSVEALSHAGGKGELARVGSALDAESPPASLAVLDTDVVRLTVVGLPLAPAQAESVHKQLHALLASTHPVSATEAQRVAPPVIRIESLAQTSLIAPAGQAFADHPQARWELLNQLEPSASPAAGRPVKTVR